jgi:hypothetical protein
MIEYFEAICRALMQPRSVAGILPILDPTDQFNTEADNTAALAAKLNAAFMILLAGKQHPEFDQARNYLSNASSSTGWTEVGRFYLEGQAIIKEEIERVCKEDQKFATRLKDLSKWLWSTPNKKDEHEVADQIWSLFFPEGAKLRQNPAESVNALRHKRLVNINLLNPDPIQDASREILFTSNVLLTLPHKLESTAELPYSEALKQKLQKVSQEAQCYWYDHPIHIGVKPEQNELLYGLRGLDAAFEFERKHGNISQNARLTCLLSVSVTHQGLHDIARAYIEEELSRTGSIRNIDVYVFTETEIRQIMDTVLAPAAEHYLGQKNAANLLEVMGVDGEYGRHYSFLKAMAAFWNICIQPEIKGTFKIDLDQVFPQQDLVSQTGASAFEHFKTPLWGARGLDSFGNPVELGMIAGALVDEKDIRQSIFTPDVRIPDRTLLPDEHIFFSSLPQAISTEAEMMTRYDTHHIDGLRTCIERVHVTGGTNGILVDSLRRLRPFTPSFIGRAEDQAYLLATLVNSENRLAYAHKDGLIMRHDKEAFAQEAIKAAEIGRILGDYIRILYYSAYAQTLSENLAAVKKIFDPFTGSFISQIPATVVHLRFGFKAASLFKKNRDNEGMEFVTSGSKRLAKALEFIRGKNSPLKQQYEKERQGWNLYYDTLDAVERALNKNSLYAKDLKHKANTIIDQCALGVIKR